MNFIRRTLTAAAPVTFGVLLLSSGASATTILGQTNAFGNTSAFPVPQAGMSQTTSVAGFNQVATDAAIQASCAITGDTCSALTLYEIDFSFTADVNATVVLQNTTGSTGYVGSIGTTTGSAGTLNGTYSGTSTAGSANTTGTVLNQESLLHLIDPSGTDVADPTPTLAVASTIQYKRSVGCGQAGAASGSNFVTCLSITGNTTSSFSGSGSANDSSDYSIADDGAGAFATEMAPYYNQSMVNFYITATGQTNNGTLTTGTIVSGNAAAVQALTNAVEVSYLYSYTDTAPTGAPEPASMVLLGGAFLAVGFARLKKRSN